MKLRILIVIRYIVACASARTVLHVQHFHIFGNSSNILAH